MRKYSLANPAFRDVDLRDYTDVIISKVHEIVPSATVIVERDGYILDDNITRGQVIKIGRNVAKSQLWKYRLPRDLLFVGKTISKRKIKMKNKRKIRGGHM